MKTKILQFNKQVIPKLAMIGALSMMSALWCGQASANLTQILPAGSFSQYWDGTTNVGGASNLYSTDFIQNTTGQLTQWGVINDNITTYNGIGVKYQSSSQLVIAQAGGNAYLQAATAGENLRDITISLYNDATTRSNVNTNKLPATPLVDGAYNFHDIYLNIKGADAGTQVKVNTILGTDTYGLTAADNQGQNKSYFVYKGSVGIAGIKSIEILGSLTALTLGYDQIKQVYFSGPLTLTNGGGDDLPKVPLPAALWMVGPALLGLVGFGRRKSLSMNEDKFAA